MSLPHFEVRSDCKVPADCVATAFTMNGANTMGSVSRRFSGFPVVNRRAEAGLRQDRDAGNLGLNSGLPFLRSGLVDGRSFGVYGDGYGHVLNFELVDGFHP